MDMPHAPTRRIYVVPDYYNTWYYQYMWQETEQGLYRRFEFKDFNEAFAFMKKVAALAESQSHHPRWFNEWNIVEIWLQTHDESVAITDKDRALADSIDIVKG